MAISKTTLLRALRSTTPRHTPSHPLRQAFHSSPRYAIIKSFPLADIGEGITECQLIQWFVQPGARVQQFDKLCEVQSDKASVEITSPYEGVVTKLWYEPDEMAVTGRSLVDMDVDEDDVAGGGGGGGEVKVERAASVDVEGGRGDSDQKREGRRSNGKQDHSSLATPAVRHLTKELKVSITDVQGTGKDGRVLKEDVHRHVQSQQNPPSTSSPQPAASQPRPTSSNRTDRTVPLSPIQTQMFRAMTRSLAIPHFLYTTTVDITSLTALRQKLNNTTKTPLDNSSEIKLTQLPFILKAVSLSLNHHPLLNASLSTPQSTSSSTGEKPELTYHTSHNFGIAIDTPTGLLVPVIRDIQDLTILEIASQLLHLSHHARSGTLSPSDFSGATFTVSNIGNIGGLVVAPVISAPQVAILGIGRSRVVPAFADAKEGGGLGLLERGS
ncbi:hypothetical protein LTR49_023693 [Elasticomyces elasticus]|nr:hypothetical protein LTR49_023693 [Elasticomyces elasticus]